MADILENLTELIECVICREELTDPRILACHHSFCLQCLKDLVNYQEEVTATSMLCPTCRQETKYPTGGLIKLPVDFRAIQMKQLLASQDQNQQKRGRVAFCDVCSAMKPSTLMPARGFCSQCTFLFCKDCVEEHSSNQLTSSHDVSNLAIEDYEGTSTCKSHGDAANWYCWQCKEGVCYICTKATRHTDHDIHPPEAAYEHILEEANSVFGGINSRCVSTDIGKEIERLEAEQIRVKSHCDEIRNSVRQQAEAAIAKIKTSEEMLLDIVQSFETKHEEERSQLLAQLYKIRQSQSQFSEGLNLDVQRVTEHALALEELQKLSEDINWKNFTTLSAELPTFTAVDTTEIGIISIAHKAHSGDDDASMVSRAPASLMSVDAPGERPVKAVIKHTITNITELSEPDVSPKMLVQSLMWNIMVKPLKKDYEHYLGIYLQCDKYLLCGRKCQVDALLMLVNQEDEANSSLILPISHTFTEQHDDWGFKKYIAMDDLLEPTRGFVKDDTIVVKADMDVHKTHI